MHCFDAEVQASDLGLKENKKKKKSTNIVNDCQPGLNTLKSAEVKYKLVEEFIYQH